MSITIPFFWSDIAEIACIGYLFHQFSSFLASDKDSSLLNILYLYCGAIFLCNLLQLQIISTILLVSSPLFLTLTIIFHQHSLQKNYILSKNRLISPNESIDWINILISVFIARLHNKQPLFCIIEYTDAIEPLIDRATIINIPCTKHMLEIICDSNRYQSHHHLWISSSGTLKAINTTLKSLSPSHSDSDWYMQAEDLSALSDALIIKGNATGSFDVVARKKIYTNISSVDLHTFIRSYQSFIISPRGSSHDLSQPYHNQQIRP